MYQQLLIGAKHTTFQVMLLRQEVQTAPLRQVKKTRNRIHVGLILIVANGQA